MNQKPETNTKHKTTPNNPTQTKKPNHTKGVPKNDNNTRKLTTLPELWSNMKTKETRNHEKPDNKNQKSAENLNQEKEKPITTRIVTLKPPKKTDEPKTKKPKPKTMNQNQPSTQISSMTKFFETVFKPRDQESETKPKNQTSETLKTKPKNQTSENLKTKTRNQENAATNISIRKPTFNLPTTAKIVVTPVNDDKPSEFPSTPQTSHTLNPPTISDASHHPYSRNLPPNITQRNLPPLSSSAPELGIGSTNSSRDNMCTRNQHRGEHDWPKISTGGRTNQS